MCLRSSSYCNTDLYQTLFHRKTLKHGKHVLIEFPLCLSAEQGKDLFNLAESKGTYRYIDILGRVVLKPINTNPRLKINQGFHLAHKNVLKAYFKPVVKKSLSQN